jgi:nitroreductase
MMPRDLTPDQLLSTTRAVRKRLDLSRPVEPELLNECLDLAFQAPTGGNAQGWHFVLVTEAHRKRAISELYRRSKRENDPSSTPPEHQRSMDSSAYLAQHLHEVPVLVVPCIEGRVENAPLLQQAVTWASILPATWSFMLAGRARGLGTAWTSLHLAYEREAAAVLEIPHEQVMQVALIPVAHTCRGGAAWLVVVMVGGLGFTSRWARIRSMAPLTTSNWRAIKMRRRLR